MVKNDDRNCPNQVKEIDIQVQETHRAPNKINSKRPTPWHMLIKMPKVKDKERMLNAAREEQLIIYKGDSIRLSVDFSTETLQARRDYHKIFKVIISKDLQPRSLCPAKLTSNIDGQIKNFPDKKKLKRFITTKPILQEMLKGLL